MNPPVNCRPAKVAHAYNMDHIFAFEGKIVCKTGQLILRPCGAIERFGYYLKNRNKLFVQK